jgi:ubiquinone/menaquinone biosynthesis C-methylase UbiE
LVNESDKNCPCWAFLGDPHKPDFGFTISIVYNTAYWPAQGAVAIEQADFLCSLELVRRQREKIVPRAEGRVLEVGIGTGLNVRHYDKTKVGKITGLDPALEMHRLASKRIAQAGLDVDLVGLSAEEIPLGDASFDCVVVTYTLCSVPDPVTALKEIRRVLKTGGRFLFCEHGRAPDERVRRWQDRLTPYWKNIAGGCRLNRDITALISEAGFACRDLQTMYLPGPRPLTYNYWGEAVPV